jgi:hypothetical protein
MKMNAQNIKLTMVAVLLIAGGISVRAGIRYVSPTGNDANAGTSWAAAKLTVQAAVATAVTGDTVLVTNGVYALTSAINITNAIVLTSVNGSSATILDGQQAGRCVLINGFTATVNGFTLRNGRAINGGGVYCNGGTIQNCVLTSNQAIGNDVSDGSGGGAYMAYGTLSNCVVYANIAQSTNSYQSAWGGGVYSYGSVMQSCVVSNNQCTADYANGGGVVLVGGTLRNSRVTGNSAVALSYASGGGAYATILQLSVPSFIEACLITNNSVTTTDTYAYTAANAQGGGMYIGNGTTVRSTLVTGNIAHSVAGFTTGGGVWTSGSILENCTVAYNTATTQNGNLGSGGGVNWGYNDQGYNNIIKFNSAGNGPDNWEVNQFNYPIFVNSDIGIYVPSTNTLNCISADPLFVNAAAGDFHLQTASPCRNAGTNETWMAGALDLESKSRIAESIVDMGAFEVLTVSVPPQLTIIRSATNVVLTWPTNAAGFTLQSSTNLVSSAVWSTVSPVPVIVNGKNTVTNVISGTRKFFRLSQ